MKTLCALGVLVALQAAPPGQDPKFTYDEWEAWNSFGVGAAVEHATETTTGITHTRRTIQKKDGTTVDIAVVRKTKVGEEEVQAEEAEQVRKPAGPKAAAPVCPSCKKAHPKDMKESAEKVKVDKVELECVLQESTVFDCAGKKIGQIRRWYNKSVPGWLVKMESVVEDMRTTTTCVKFEEKR